MSQVIRKFQNSGKIEQNKPELFERHGVGKYNKADLVSGLYRNIDTYIKNNNLSGDRAISFRNSANQFIKGIENGTITMNGDGTFSDSSGQMSSTGKFDKNWIGRKKDTSNNAFNLVGDYALDYINQMPQYTEPTPTPKSKFNANEFLTKEISKRWYGGNNIDFDNWFKNRAENDRNALLGEIFNNADYNKLYQDYDWNDTGITSAEDLAARFKGFGSAIVNNKLDNDDYNRFAELGGSGLDKFMKETKEVQEPTTEQTKLKAWEEEARAAGATTPEAISAYVQGKQREEADKNAAIIKANEQDIYNRERDKYFDDFVSQNPFKGTISGYVASDTSYNPEKQNDFISTTYGDNYGGFTKYMQAVLNPKYFSGELKQTQNGNDVTSQHLANNLDIALKSGYLDDLGDGNYGIPGTYNYDNWSFISYNPSTRQYKETSMLANQNYRKLLAYKEYDKRKSSIKKDGGIMKYQQGGDTKEAAYLRYKQQFAENKKEKKQQVAAKAKATNRTPEQVEAGGRKPMSEDWEYEDYARLVSAGADVGSMIASFVPGYGTIASAGLGLGSTVGNFTADLADESVSLGSAFGNAALGLGMDVVGLIPGLGAAGKGSKIVKNLLKVAPKLMTIWGTSTSFAPAMQAFNKLRDKGASEMTVDDWRALSNGLTAAAGATRWGASSARNKILTNKYGTTTRTVTTKSGKQIEMSEDEFRRIKGASGIEGQNKALRDVKGAENEELPTTFKKWYNPKRILEGTPESSKNIVINTDAMKRVTPDGTVLVPTKYSNEGIWKEAVNNSWGGNWKGWQGPNWLKDWGYTPTSQKSSPKVTKNTDNSNIDTKAVNETVDAVSSMVKSLNIASKFKSTLALPAPGQTTPSNRVFIMGSSKSNIKDKTNPSKLQKPGSYIDRAVPVGGTPVEAPDAGTIRTVNAVNSILKPFTNSPRNLPAVIPASRNAEKVVASKTIQPTKRLDQFIEDQIPGGLIYGRARAKREKEYKDIFQPAVEAEYNKVWDDMYGIKDGWMFPQAASNEKAANITMRGLINKRQAARNAAENVNRQIAMAVAEQVPKRPTRAEHNRRQGQLTATFNQKQYDMKEALRNRELPHKKSNKKKKTSKDNKVKRREWGGLLFKDGGLIPKFQSPAGPIRIQAKDMSGWDRNKALASYDFGADVDRWRKSYTGDDNWQDAYITAFNGGEDLYDTLTSKTGDYFGGKYNYSVQDPLAKQRQVTFRGTNQGFDDLIRQGIIGYGTTEGTTGFDIYAGDRTGNRTLSRGLSSADVARFNEQLSTRGLELYDKGDGSYRLRKLQTPTVDLPEVEMAANKNTPLSTITPGVDKAKKSFNFNIIPEDAIALGRMLGGLATNNRAAELYKKGLKPNLIDTFENTVPLQGNLQAKLNAEQQASNIESIASRPRTSDASLQLAGELEASNKANQTRFQGILQDAEMFYKTRMLGQQESDAAKARRVEVANKNRAAMNQIDAAKKQIDAARVTANYAQVLAPFLAGIENQFAQKRAINQQLDLESAQKEAERLYSPEFDRLTDDYNAAYKAYGAKNNNDYTGWETSNEYKSLIGRRKALNNNVSQFLLDKRKSIIDSPYMFQFEQNSTQKIPYSKSGSKLTATDRKKIQRAKDFNKRLLEDNKQFHKDIMESKREHNKMIISMSSLTAELIKKAMS